MKEQLETLISIARSAWRFRWLALGAFAATVILGSLAVLLAPGMYESRAQIYVDTKSVLRPLLQGVAVASQVRDDTDVVQRALLARPTLDNVARKTGLYARTKSPEKVDVLLKDLAEKISIHGDSSSGLYSIAYTDSSPQTAQAVVLALLDTFVSDSVGTRRADAQNAEKFLARQVVEYEKRLSDSEQQLAEFKKRNIGLMPDQRGDYFTRLQAELANRAKIQSDLAIVLQQRDELRRKIAGDSGSEAAALTPPTNQEIQSAVALDARIRDARTQLDSLLERYTDAHPQVLAQKEAIRRLEEQRQRELGGIRSTNGTRGQGGGAPVDAVVQNLQIALNSADVQAAALQTQLRQKDAVIADLQKTVTTGPEIEAELARLNRDYGVTKTQYETLLQRLETARISNDVDRSEELKFKILDPPHIPVLPVSPKRSMLLAGVVVFAFIAAFAVALLRGQTQPVYFSKSALRSAIALPIVGVVTRAYWDEEQSQRRREYALYALLGAAVVVMVAGAMVFNFRASQALRHVLGLEVG